MANNDKKQQKEQPIIVKKKKGHGGHGHHGGAWKVAYADFVTAMMAFFIVMWILASSEETKMLITAYFDDPGAFNFVTGEAKVPIDLNLMMKQNKGKGKSNMMFDFSDELRDSVVSKLREKAIKDSIDAAERVQGIANKFGKYWEELKLEKPDIKELLNSIKIEMTQEGLRIELIESSEDLFFEVGSANLKNNAVMILETIAQEIGKLPNPVEVEGHTDSRGYSSSSGYTNWDLSADRALSARRILTKDSYLWDGQVSKVTGFADRKLSNPENPFDVSNRRVSILIKHLDTKEFMANFEQ